MRRDNALISTDPANLGGSRIAIIGAGWGGLAAAVHATLAGHAVTLFEAARQAGGRARALELRLPDGQTLPADNGQHILIGAYRECLALLRTVGVDADQALLRRPLALEYADGSGLRLPDWSAPWNCAWGILRARGWRWRERLALLQAALRWRRDGFACAPHRTVADLCEGLPRRAVDEFIEPLCVAALNTPVQEAGGAVFLRVLHDALLGERGSSDTLLPRVDLGALFPQPAMRWLRARGAHVRLGARVEAIHWQGTHWQVAGAGFDHVICATSAPEATRILQRSAQAAPSVIAARMLAWTRTTAQLQHRAITTVHARAVRPEATAPLLRAPMLALRSSREAPAQFVFERDAIARDGRSTGLLAFVISDSAGDRRALEAAVVAQARGQLGLAVQPVRTVAERRATFACTAGMQRPPMTIAPGLHACGDYVEGPYPATLEGAARTATTLVRSLPAAQRTALESASQAGVVQW